MYVYTCTSATPRSLCKCTSHPIIYDVWAEYHYIRYRRRGLTLSVCIRWAVNDRYDISFCRAGEARGYEEIIKEGIIHELLCCL